MQLKQNDWLLYPYVHGSYPESLIHPDDLPKAVAGIGIVKYLGNDGDYLVLETFTTTIRAREHEHIATLPGAPHKPGSHVRDRNRPHVIGEVDQVSWHYKNNCFFYTLLIEGKRNTKRYLHDELELIQAT